MAEKKLSSVYVSWPKPDFLHTVKTNKHFRQCFHGAMQYAHYEMSSNDLKREVIKYLKAKDNKHPLLERIKDMNEHRFITIGKYMYVLNHGGDLPDGLLDRIIPALEKIIDEEEIRIASIETTTTSTNRKNNGASESVIPVKAIISIQDRIRDKAREVAGEMEGWIDDFCINKKIQPKTVDEFVNLFKTNDLKAAHINHITGIFGRRAKEISDASIGKDKDLTEAYSNFTVGELKKYDTLYKNLLKACGMIQDVAKVERTPRKKASISSEKIVARLKFKKEDTTLGIVSLNPIHIIGSKEVWIYNIRTRKLSQYKAIDESGLSVKGASLINFMPDSAEKTLRKPPEALAEFKKASKVKLRTFLADLTTIDTVPTGKLNEHSVILRIDK